MASLSAHSGDVAQSSRPEAEVTAIAVNSTISPVAVSSTITPGNLLHTMSAVLHLRRTRDLSLALLHGLLERDKQMTAAAVATINNLSKIDPPPTRPFSRHVQSNLPALENASHDLVSQASALVGLLSGGSLADLAGLLGAAASSIRGNACSRDCLLALRHLFGRQEEAQVHLRILALRVVALNEPEIHDLLWLGVRSFPWGQKVPKGKKPSDLLRFLEQQEVVRLRAVYGRAAQM